MRKEDRGAERLCFLIPFPFLPLLGDRLDDLVEEHAGAPPELLGGAHVERRVVDKVAFRRITQPDGAHGGGVVVVLGLAGKVVERVVAVDDALDVRVELQQAQDAARVVLVRVGQREHPTLAPVQVRQQPLHRPVWLQDLLERERGIALPVVV